MKKIMLLTLTLMIAPLYASNNCIDNTQKLENLFDSKEWHSVDCNCNCKNLRKDICFECGHKQNAHPWTIIQPDSGAKVAQRSLVSAPATVQDALKNLIALKNKQYVQ